jgi:hypothetical protein
MVDEDQIKGLDDAYVWAMICNEFSVAAEGVPTCLVPKGMHGT